MPRPNYHHARREKERVRKARQQEKMQRRTGRESASPAIAPQTDAPVTTAESSQPGDPLQLQSGK